MDLGNEEITICALSKFHNESVSLDLPISAPTFTFSVKGAEKTHIHLLGRYVYSYDDDSSIWLNVKG